MTKIIGVSEMEFAESLKATDLYAEDFIKRMEQAEEDIRAGRTKKFKNTEAFLKSLS
jgi:hypothetical protein